MVTLSDLRSILNREITQKTPRVIELRMPGETIVIPPTAESVINELIIRDAEEVELIKCDSTYLVDREFEYALTVEVR